VFWYNFAEFIEVLSPCSGSKTVPGKQAAYSIREPDFRILQEYSLEEGT
jgi:hypothetical protein